jgi:methionyl-tRNA formyltransferase
MKVIFMGTPEFSVGTLEAIIEAGHEVVLVVTQPDKPKGRGGKMQFTPVKEVAVSKDIPVFQPKKIREAENVEYLRQYKADVMVVIAFGQILPQEILDMTRYGCINVHASLLPKWRGAAPIQWSILGGDRMTGITTMQMDAGLDTGDMLLKDDVPISETETGGSLHDKLMVAGARLLVKTLEEIEKSNLKPEKQGETTTPYAAQLNKEMGKIDWHEEAKVIERKIRALNPWPSAYTYLETKVLKIWEAKVIYGEAIEAKNGEVITVGKAYIDVKASNGVLRLMRVQLEGKKAMNVDDFLRGHEIKKGMRLG